MAPIQSAESTLFGVQAATPPVGLVEVNTLPSLSPAAQNDAVGHETDSMTFPDAAGEMACQASPPDVGVVESSNWPGPSTAAQNVALAHEIDTIL
jgi:hypothetical protein